MASSSSHSLPTLTAGGDPQQNPQQLPLLTVGGDSSQTGVGSSTVERYGVPLNPTSLAPMDLDTQAAQGNPNVTTLVVERMRTTEMVSTKVPRFNSPNKIQLQLELAELKRSLEETKEETNAAHLEQRIEIVTEAEKTMAQQREQSEDTAQQFEERAEELHTAGVAKSEN